MNRLVWFIPFVIVLGLFWFGGYTVTANPDATITLEGREKLKIQSYGCKLVLTINTPSSMTIYCKARKRVVSLKEKVNALHLGVVLEAGERVKLAGDSCALEIIKKATRQIKVGCLPLPTSTPTPTFSPTPTPTITPTQDPLGDS